MKVTTIEVAQDISIMKVDKLMRSLLTCELTFDNELEKINKRSMSHNFQTIGMRKKISDTKSSLENLEIVKSRIIYLNIGQENSMYKVLVIFKQNVLTLLI